MVLEHQKTLAALAPTLTQSIAELHAPDLQEKLEEGRRKLPWFLVSLAVHAALFFVLSLIVFTENRPDKDHIVISKVLDLETPIMEAPRISPTDTEHPIETEEKSEEEPVIKEEMADVAETDDDAETRNSNGEPEFASDHPFDALFTRGDLGLGRGGGGHYGDRGFGNKERGTPGGGQTRLSEEGVNKGLKWLADHQAEDGSWDTDGFAAECSRVGRKGDEAHTSCAGAGESKWSDPGLTGLALLAFLGAGNTMRTGEYTDVVKRAARYLINSQSPDGCIGPKDGHYMYNHSIAALALIEAYAISDRPVLMANSAQRAVDYLAAAQNPGLAWRYSSRCGDNDTSVTGWVVLALKSAHTAKLKVPRESFVGALTWIDKMTADNYHKVGYRNPGDSGSLRADAVGKFQMTESMTAVGMISRIFLGAKSNDPAVRGGAELLVDDLPEWNESKGTINMYYWYYGSLAMYQVGGEAWKRWNQALHPALVDTQRGGEGTGGSWDPIGAWGRDGGRVYATAINVLTLEIYYRYKRLL